jgi:uncharacterized cupredoxin-like copper-binding protein
MIVRLASKSGLFALALGLAASSSAFAATTVKVTLNDKGGEMDFSQDMKLGMGMHGDPAKALAHVVVDKKIVPAGKVTFDVKDASKETIHEMLVGKVASPDAALPFKADENRIDEGAFKSLGEVSELDPGKAGTLTLDMTPGTYVLFCNIPGHFEAGMWTTIIVQ